MRAVADGSPCPMLSPPPVQGACAVCFVGTLGGFCVYSIAPWRRALTCLPLHKAQASTTLTIPPLCFLGPTPFPHAPSVALLSYALLTRRSSWTPATDSFMDDRYGGDSRGSGTPPPTATQRDPSLYPQARAYRPVAASPPTDVVTTTPGGPRRSPPLAFIAGVDHSRAATYTDRVLHDNDQEMRASSPSVSPSLQLPSEVTLSGVGATLRGEQGGGGSSNVSATHFGASVCSSGSREHRTSPSISRPSSSAAKIRAAAAASPASADLFSVSAHYFHGEHRRKEGRDLPSEEEEVATAAHLFTPPFSASRKGNPPRRGSPPRDANSRPGTVTTSPMSAPIDVLQALLTPPAATGGTLVVAESSPASAGERGTREKLRLPEAAVAGVTEASGALGGPGGSYDDGVRRSGNTGDGVDALERLLLRSSSSTAAVSKGRRVSADTDVDADSGADAGATSAVGAVARRVASRQSENCDRGCEAGVEVDLRCGDFPRMPDNEEASSPSKPLRVSARRVDAAASGDEHAGTMRETTPLGTAEIGWTPAGRRSGGDGGSGSSDDSGSGGIGGFRNESGLFPAARGVTELPESPLPQRPLGGKRWRDIREGVGDQGEPSGQNQSELEELEVRGRRRKKLGLFFAFAHGVWFGFPLTSNGRRCFETFPCQRGMLVFPSPIY